MIEQTIPLSDLTAGLARCVREWILPHLTDGMARLQAEQLAGLLEALPRMLAPAALATIRTDSNETRALLERLGETPPPPAAEGALEALMEENAALKRALMALAERARHGAGADAERLHAVQRFFMRSLARELGAAVSEGTDMASLTHKDRAARRK